MTYHVAATDIMYIPGLSTLGSRLAAKGIELTVLTTGPDHPRDLSQYDALVVQGLNFDNEYIQHLSPQKTRLVLRYGAGYDKLDVDALTKKGIRAANLPDFAVEPTAQHTLAHIHELACRTIENHRWMIEKKDRKEGKSSWTHEDMLKSVPLYESTLGIVGYGRIGKRVAEVAYQSFNGNIYVYHPNFDPNSQHNTDLTFTDTLDELLQKSDFVTLHVPLFKKQQDIFRDANRSVRYEATVGLVGERQFSQMPDGSFLINTARGGLVDQEALIGAIKSGKLAGAALDVFQEEPLDKHHELRSLAKTHNLVITPHSASLTLTSSERMQESAADEIINVLLNNKEPKRLINPNYVNFVQ